MSSVTDLPLYRSSSFRLAIVLTLVIWVISAGITVAIVTLTERTLLDRVSESIDAEIAVLVDVTNEAEIELWEWFAEEIESLVINTESLRKFDPIEHQRAYLAMLRHLADEGSAQERTGANARLFLLDQTGDIADTSLLGEIYAALIFEEAPDELHDELANTIERRLRLLPRTQLWRSLTPAERLAVIVDSRRQRPRSDNRCFALLEPDGDAGSRAFVNQPSIERNEFFAVRIESPSTFDRESNLCWVRRLELPDNRGLLLGREETELLDAVASIRRWRNGAVAVSLLIAIALGTMLGRRTYARLRAINALTSEIRSGNLERRLRVSERRDDFDLLSANINTMLDQITQLMSGVKQVSDNIAHDLRTPLTRLRNRIEQLTMTDSPSREDIASLAEQADSVLATFTALLRIAQLEQGSKRRHFVTFDLSTVIHEVVDLYDVVFAERSIKLTASVPDRLNVHGDRDLWMQAFTNLLENALKYAPDSPAVTIAVGRLADTWQIDVRDQGSGVPEHALDQLSERFYRVTVDRTLPGTGLGLSLVAAVCHLHDAKLTFRNDGGLIARILLPAG
ncbi:MAG: HAMP domain-containing sensor histidine kinase [Pseudomonadota bacterium]